MQNVALSIQCHKALILKTEGWSDDSLFLTQMIHSLISKSLQCLHWFVCVCVSYHFWGHPGNHIMDSLPKDAQGGENEHNPKDHTCSANTQTGSSMLGVSFSHCDPFATPATRKLHRVETKQSAKQADRNSSHTSSQFLFLYLLHFIIFLLLLQPKQMFTVSPHEQ